MAQTSGTQRNQLIYIYINTVIILRFLPSKSFPAVLQSEVGYGRILLAAPNAASSMGAAVMDRNSWSPVAPLLGAWQGIQCSTHPEDMNILARSMGLIANHSKKTSEKAK
jgi:hypothetical protein